MDFSGEQLTAWSLQLDTRALSMGIASVLTGLQGPLWAAGPGQQVQPRSLLPAPRPSLETRLPTSTTSPSFKQVPGGGGEAASFI